MKIKKLNESVIEEADGQPAGETAEIAADIKDGAEEAGVAISDAVANKEAQNAKDVEEKVLFTLVPERYKTGKVSEIEKVLQDALESVVRNKDGGINKNFPNVLLYGLAGFGKTAVVEEFCKEHGIYPVSIDVSTLAPEKIAGIPYPVKQADGTYEQQDVVAQAWADCAKYENVILIIDEINRAQNKAVVSSLHELINNHVLPVSGVDEYGRNVSSRRLDNILFTVAMCNPISRELFSSGEVNELGSALLNRFSIKRTVQPNKLEFYNVLSRIYNAIFNGVGKNLLPQHLDVYKGQFDIATELLKTANNGFEFDDYDKAVRAHKSQRSGMDIRDTLTYRSFTAALLNCNGTKDSFLKWVSYACFLPETEQMIKNALKTYTDKIGKGNSAFQKNANPAAAAISAKLNAGVISKLDDFKDGLEA